MKSISSFSSIDFEEKKWYEDNIKKNQFLYMMTVIGNDIESNGCETVCYVLYIFTSVDVVQECVSTIS